jgi:hypothetical protein
VPNNIEPETPSRAHDSFDVGGALRYMYDVATTINDNDDQTFVTKQ